MSSKVAGHMVKLLSETLEEADTLGLAIWGEVPNIKMQSVLDNRKSSVVHDLSKLIGFLTELRRNVEGLRMVGEEERHEHE